MSIRRMMLFTLGAKIKNLIEAFKTRVLGSQGEFEAETCLDTQLTDLNNKGLLDSASFVVTPNGYEENLLFAIEPDNVGTNLLLHSQDWTQAVWQKGGSTIVSSTRVAPDGTSTGTELSDVGASSTPGVPIQDFTTTSTTVTFSIYTKAVSLPTNGRRRFLLRNNTTATDFDILDFNYSSTGSLGNGWFSQNVGNGWFRLSYTRTTGISIGNALRIYYGRTNTAPVGATDVWQVWGAQVDTSNTLNEYIPTTSARIINGTIGDMSVTRATTGTRVNADGLIEEVPYNLIQRSEEFENALWIKNESSIISNSTISPSGVQNADSFIENTATALHQCIFTTSAASGIYTATIYAKPNGRNWLFFNIAAAANYGVWFDIQNGVVGTIQSNITSASITNASNGWYRCIITANTGVVSPRISVTLSIGNNNTSYLGNGTSGIFIWGAQLVTGTQPRDYFPTTNRFNVPRIDYSNGSCPSILVEPQRTNLVLRSEEFDNASWFKTTGVVVTSNSEMSPNGTLTADTINFGASNRLVSQTTTLATGVVVTGSIYVKGISGQTIQLAVGGVDVLFTLNGSWQRLEATRTSLNNTININTFGGATARIISVWGAQLELGANATSYIPTVASTVTRNADVISNTNIGTLIGQTEGTVFLDSFYPSGITSGSIEFFSIYNTSSAYLFRCRVTPASGNLCTIIYNNGGTAEILTPTFTLTPNTRVKIAVVYDYATKTSKVFRNGSLIGSTTGVQSYPTSQDKINVGGFFGVPGTYYNNQVAFWKTKLTDAQAIQLTTL